MVFIYQRVPAESAVGVGGGGTLSLACRAHPGSVFFTLSPDRFFSDSEKNNFFTNAWKKTHTLN